MNNELKLILATHLALYRRHPWLMALFFLGFSLGGALLTAISVLNQEAKSRYKQSSALLENPVSHLVRPPIGQEYISGDIWIALKRMGILHASPVLTGKIKTKAGTTLAVKGVDTLQWFDGTSKPSTLSQPVSTEKSISSNSFLTGLLVDQQFKSRLTNKSGQLLLFELDQSLTQPNITFAEDIGFAAIADIAYVDALLDTGGSISYIELSYLKPEDLKRIKQLIAGEAELIESDQQEFDVLSEAFFFNLTALALLGYVVAAYLSFNAIKLTLRARKKILAQMQLLGCTKGAINISLSMELLTVSLITALIGSLGGYVMANGLILDVNRTLVNLYQLEKALTIHWHWHNVTLGLLLNIGALSIILLSQSRLFQTLSRSIYIGLILLVCCAFFWFYLFADTKFDALLLCFTILVFFILLAPKLMEKLVYLPLGFKHPLVNWLYQDTRFHIKDLHIAIVAILVALGSAIGMQIMVNSFSNTLSAHLEKQLSADIYLRSSKLDTELRKQLTLEPEVAQVSIYLQSEGSVDSVPATLASFGPDASHYAHIGLTSGEVVSTSLFAQQGCLVNEQGLIKFGLVENQNISFKQGKRQFQKWYGLWKNL